jgi:ribonuclease-3
MKSSQFHSLVQPGPVDDDGTVPPTQGIMKGGTMADLVLDNHSEREAVRLAEQRIQVVFQSKELLRRALTHRSYAHEFGSLENNERLELLGDAVIGLVVTVTLYSRFQVMEEGDLTQLKSFLVSRRLQAKAARALGLHECLLIGTSERRTGGRKRQSTLAGLFEAVIGAIYLDQGLDVVKTTLDRTILLNISEFSSPAELKDPKTKLQELLQGRGLGQPAYKLLSTRGPDHCPTFTITVWIGTRELGSGKGNSKKEAERAAALEALRVLKDPVRRADHDVTPQVDVVPAE